MGKLGKCYQGEERQENSLEKLCIYRCFFLKIRPQQFTPHAPQPITVSSNNRIPATSPGPALQLHPLPLALGGPDGGQVPFDLPVHLLCEQSGAVGGPGWEEVGDR